VAALSAARSKDTYYSARYRRIAGSHRPATSRRGKARRPSVPALIALVALEHKMLTDAWNILVNGAFYRDPGADYYTRHHPGQTQAKAIKQLQALGYKVTLEPLIEAA
jgi:transposase